MSKAKIVAYDHKLQKSEKVGAGYVIRRCFWTPLACAPTTLVAGALIRSD